MTLQEPAHKRLSVTQRIRGVPEAHIKGIRQPQGGYLPIELFHSKELDDGGIEVLGPENISPGIVGLAVDYLTRFQFTNNAEMSFPVARKGMEKLLELYEIDERKYFDELMNKIEGVDDTSIVAACRLAGFDSVFRAGRYSPVREILPDKTTISNIKRMVKRCEIFVHDKSILDDDIVWGPTFQGGYTDTVSYGDADFCTAFFMCDIKTSEKPPGKNDTLQVLMYLLLARHAANDFNGFRYLSILALFNARTNIEYSLDLFEVDEKIQHEVEYDIIGYDSLCDSLEKDRVDYAKRLDILKNLGII